MNAELKAKWIAALRSGKYQQGTSALTESRFSRFCCLGVLCDVAGLERRAKSGFLTRDGIDFSMFAPQELLPDVKDKDHQALLSKMNDGGASFAEIADWIEANVEATS